MILLIDNYDSFVYNLARYLEELNCETLVLRNDVSIEDVASHDPAAIVISPGPCSPSAAGVSVELVRQLGSTIPILGVCLGHQAIAAAFGGRIVRAPQPIHGQTSSIQHSAQGLFAGLPQPLQATRYHSLIVDESTLPSELEVTARTSDGIPMALQHQMLPVMGVQFHPESILTDSGHRLLWNFLQISGIDIPFDCPVERVQLPTDVSMQSSDGPIHWQVCSSTHKPRSKRS